MLFRSKAKGNQHTSARSCRSTEQNTLADMGISKDQFSRWQQLADVPEPDFEHALAAPDKPSTTGILRL